MAKLTEQQWRKARETWEADSRDGYAWLIRELGLDVSGPAVRKRALKEEWTKTEGARARAKAAEADSAPKRSRAIPPLGQPAGSRERECEWRFQDRFARLMRSGALPAKKGWAEPVSVHQEYRIGAAVCDVVAFHADGSISVCELKRGGLSVRSYMTGVGQLINASIQLGLALVHQGARREVRLILSAPGEERVDVGLACARAGIEYLPFDGEWVGETDAHDAINEVFGGVDNG